MSNRPVHILDSQGRFSPSSFIPFCEFGGNMSIMGEKISLFELPVCNMFRPKMVQGQLCYQVDVNEVKDQVDVQDAIKYGLIFLMDYNGDKMLTKNYGDEGHLTNGLHKFLTENDEQLTAKIYVDTLGSTVYN